jgi:hypothetical protein
MMRRFMLALGLSVLGLSGTGCVSRDGYAVDWLYSEHIRDRIDAQWFLREIKDTKGLAAIELVYCPIVPRQTTVCRSSVVWQREARALVDHPNLGAAPAGAR